MRYKREIKKNHLTLRYALSAPLIYALFFPALFLDLCIEIYHRLCFPLYGLNYVERSRYIRIDRHKLSYLKWWDKLNCVYCGYMNGMFLYIAAIAQETERYWCAIRHEGKGAFVEPHYQKEFLPRTEKALREYEK